MWYGDTVWPTLVGLASVAVVAGMQWWERRKPFLFVIALLCIPLAITAVVVERRIVTPREEVVARLEQLLDDFQQKNEPGVIDAVSGRAPDLQRLASHAIARVSLENVRLTDIHVEFSGEDVLRARMHFRVNADVIFDGVRPFPRQPTRWQSTWEQESDGRWRLIDIEQLDPLTGERTQEARQYVE